MLNTTPVMTMPITLSMLMSWEISDQSFSNGIQLEIEVQGFSKSILYYAMHVRTYNT